MNFQYLCTKTFEDSIEIEDIGNVCLEAMNDDGLEYFLIIKTDLGWSVIKEFGPYDVDTGPNKYTFSYYFNNRAFNEKSIRKTINNFLNDERKEITQVFFTNEQDALQKLQESVR